MKMSQANGKAPCEDRENHRRALKGTRSSSVWLGHQGAVGRGKDKAEGRGRGQALQSPCTVLRLGSPKHAVLGQGVTACDLFGDNHFSSLVRRRRWGWREMEGWCLDAGSVYRKQNRSHLRTWRVYGDEGGSLEGDWGQSVAKPTDTEQRLTPRGRSTNKIHGQKYIT